MVRTFLKTHISIGGVSTAQKALFARSIASMLKSGVPIVEALDVVIDSSEGKLKEILKSIKQSVDAGNPFSLCLGKYPRIFSGLFKNAVRAGELSGTLHENLLTVAEHLDKERELSSKIKGALLYPAVVLSATVILAFILSFAVLPKIVPLFEGLNIELPATTRALIWFTHLFQHNGILLGAGIIIFFLIIIILLRQKFIHPVTHLLLLKIPIVKNVSKNANTARFCRSLGTLLRSGITIDEAIAVSKDAVGNYYYQSALMDLSKRIGKGSQLSADLGGYPHLFSLMVIKMIHVGEKTGRLDGTLLYLADYYEKEVDNATKLLSASIEPILLIIIGTAVAFFALSIITPIYKITGSLGR